MSAFAKEVTISMARVQLPSTDQISYAVDENGHEQAYSLWLAPAAARLGLLKAPTRQQLRWLLAGLSPDGRHELVQKVDRELNADSKGD